MKKLITKYLRAVFARVFETEIGKLHASIDKVNCMEMELRESLYQSVNLKNKMKLFFESVGVAVDVHEYPSKYSRSWAVVALQGKKADYIKFMDLGDADIQRIGEFLKHFEKDQNIIVDASPRASNFLKTNR